MLVAGMALSSCGGWSSGETYTGDIRPTVERPPGAGLGATAEPIEPVDPLTPVEADAAADPTS